MSAFEIRGWCPGTLRPMLSGDGLVVRVHPPLGRLTCEQARGLARLAATHGNGLIDLSNRASLQLRGVSEDGFPELIEGLSALGLVDQRTGSRGGGAIIVNPFWQAGDDTQMLADSLAAMLASLAAPDLPDKFGFAVDCAGQPVLSAVSADIRIERSAGQGLICRADGAGQGRAVTMATAAAAALELAQWFVASGGVKNGRGRMAAHLARNQSPLPPDYRQVAAPAPSGDGWDAGPHPLGFLVGAEFGQLQSQTLLALAGLGPLRLTPWRLWLVEGAQGPPELDGVLLQPGHPLRRVDACTGAPGCLQAHGPTRALARELAPTLPAGLHLHVSGCGKGCARSAPSALTLVARPGGVFDLIRNGNAAAAPLRTGLRPEILIARPETLYESP